jgi:hypothetical protein
MEVMAKDDPIITPTTDLFIASLWSAPKNEPILRSLLNAVMTDIGLPTIVEAKVLNPFNIQEYPTDKQIRLDVLVEDESKSRYNIEVQTDSHTSFFDRMLYYILGGDVWFAAGTRGQLPQTPSGAEYCDYGVSGLPGIGGVTHGI